MMPKAVSDALHTLVAHGYIAKLEIMFAMQKRYLKSISHADSYIECQYTHAGVALGKEIVKQREFLLTEQKSMDYEHYDWVRHKLGLMIVRAKPDPETDRRIFEESWAALQREMMEGKDE